MPTTVNAAAVSYPFPGRAQDLPPKHYWWVHDVHDGGIQRLGYDITAVHFDVAEKTWTQRKAGVSAEEYKQNPKNEAWSVYGQPVYAIADGEVMYAWRNAPDNPIPGVDQFHPDMDGVKISNAGNFLKVKHSDQEYVLYAHFKPGSIPTSLCPFNAVLRKDASDSELPAANRPHVKKGQFLGLVGNTGHSSGPHLHINLQKTLLDSGGSASALPMPFHGAWIKSTAKLEDSPADWQRMQGEMLPLPNIAILPDYSTGLSEIARHSLPASEYQLTFDHITKSGYRPVWVDGYEVNGANFFNLIFRPSNGIPWLARHGLTATQYQNTFNELKPKGYRPVQVESYPDGKHIRYAAIFVQQTGPDWTAYHGRTAAQHQSLFNTLTKEQGFRPINISVVSMGGQLSYTALYERQNVGSFEAHSVLTPAEYQTTYNQNSAAGRQLVYLNAYNHAGNVHFTAIWHSAVPGITTARHGLSTASYQQEWTKETGQGFHTCGVTGYDAGVNANFAAFWRK